MKAFIPKFLLPPKYDNFEKNHQARFLHITLSVVFFAGIAFGVTNYNMEAVNLAIFMFLLSGLCVVGIILNHNDHYMPGAIILALMVLFVMDYNLIDGGALHDPGVAAFPIYIIFMSFIFGRKAITVSTVLCIASIFMVYFIGTQGIMELNYTPTVNRVTILTILVLVTAFLIWTVTNSLEGAVYRLEEAYENTLAGWGKVLEYRDADTQGHSQRVTDLSVALAEEMGCPPEDLQLIRRGSLLHDIGKLAIPDDILFKADFLDDAERAVIEKHPTYAKEILAEIPFLENILDIPYSHHERWDGKGYPQGLKEKDIPLAARIFTIIDYWDSLCSDRPYRNAWPKNKALAYIKANSGIIFDPKVVEAFVKMIAKTENLKPQ